MMRREKLWRHTGWRACLLLTLCSLLALIGQRSRHLCVCRFQHRGG